MATPKAAGLIVIMFSMVIIHSFLTGNGKRHRSKMVFLIREKGNGIKKGPTTKIDAHPKVSW